MLQTVKEVAAQLGVSDVTIYSKLKQKKFKDKVTLRSGKTYINEELFNLIKSSLKSQQNVNLDEEEVAVEVDTEQLDGDLTNLINQLKQAYEDRITDLVTQNDYLKGLVEQRDKEIERLSNLFENTQVLFKQAQEKDQQNIPKLEAHFKEVDDRLMELREELKTRKDQKKSSIFSRIFHKE